MPRVPRGQDELAQELRDQLHFIVNSAQSFDQGFAGEAKRLALTIRVLVHDTEASRSLLGQLGMKDNVAFKDLSLPYDSYNLVAHSGLTKIHIDQQQTRILPLFNDSPIPPRDLSFDEWWNGIVFVDQNGVQHSRRDLVLTLANQDGGGHVDPELDQEYVNLSRNNSLGYMEIRGNREQPLPNQVPAAVRHIAHEVLMTLDPSYEFREPPISDGFVTMGMALHQASTAPAWPARNTTKIPKVGRNDPCLCGSGKKYKKCHGQ